MRNKKIYLGVVILILLSLSGCKCAYNKRIKEADILYVKPWDSRDNNRFMYADKFGEFVVPREYATSYHKAHPFSCGLGLVLDHNNEWKYINNKGEVVIDASEYSMCWSFEEDICPHVWGLKGLAYVYKGRVLDPCPSYYEYKEITKENESNDGKYGLINMKGQVVLPVEYDAIIVRPLSRKDHIWLVRQNGLYGVLNKKFKLIIPVKYQTMAHFRQGNSMVKLNGYWGLINKKEKTIFPFTIKEIGHVNREPASYYLVRQDMNWGIISQKGKTIVPFDYTRWEPYPDYSIIRMYKEDGSFITWIVQEDKIMK